MDEQKIVEREAPELQEQRKALVKHWCDKITSAKKHHSKKFKQMRDDMKFARGKQWPTAKQKYVANITQRHIRQRVSSLYAKNPKASAKRRDRIDFKLWDEKPESMMMAQQYLMGVQPGMEALDPMAAQSQELLADIQEGMQRRQMLTKVGKTQEILFHYYLDEQLPRFKISAKALVGRTCVASVGYVKLGFQRAMEKSADTHQRIADMSEQLSYVESLNADIADGETDVDAKEVEELRIALAALQEKDDVIVREGLVMDFPKSTSVIVDPDCTSLRGFVGANFVAQEFMFTPEDIKSIYKVDLAKNYNPYTKGSYASKSANGKVCVWEIYCKKTKRMITVADGYPNFLEEPTEPHVDIEQFYPFFPLVFNEIESEDELFPPSDVELMRDSQIDYNRAREGLREHRVAARPRYITPAGKLEDDDKERMALAVAHEVVEIQQLAPGESIDSVIQPWRGAPIDPNMYDTTYTFDDTQRVLGSQEANFGGTSGGTATESSIAEGSRMSSVSSNVDDLDDFLTDLARASGQVMLQEVSAETAMKIAGPGAVWPDLNREEIMDEIYLEVVAGSSGRPNKAQEIANFERLAPTLLQIPGISPVWLAREALNRMDDRLDLTEALMEGMPSITAMNAQTQVGTGDPESDPNQQGGQGGDNSSKPAQGNEGGQPEYPTAG